MSTPTTAHIAIVFGSWKIRHNQPLEAKDCTLYAIDAGVALVGKHTVVVDLRGRYTMLARWGEDGAPVMSGLGDVDTHNLSDSFIPLAVVRLQSGRVHISHLLGRVDVHRSLFEQPPQVIDQPGSLAELAPALWQAFELNHLAINNWECRYRKSACSWVESFTVDARCHARMLGESWFDRSFNQAMAPFTSQCGDEFQIRDHRVTACEVEDGGYVWVEHCSHQRKLAVNQPLVQLLRSGPRGEPHSPRELSLDLPTLEAMCIAVDGPLQVVGEYYRYAFSVPCESVESGNVFVVSFETCAPLAPNSVATTRGEVRFLKSRSSIDRAAIEADLYSLMIRLRSFLGVYGATCQPLVDRFAFLRSPIPPALIATGRSS